MMIFMISTEYLLICFAFNGLYQEIEECKAAKRAIVDAALDKVFSDFVSCNILKVTSNKVPNKIKMYEEMIASTGILRINELLIFNSWPTVVLIIVFFYLIFFLFIWALSDFTKSNYFKQFKSNINKLKKKIVVSSKLYEKNEAVYKAHLKLIDKLNFLSDQPLWRFSDESDFADINLALKNFNIIMLNNYENKIVLSIYKIQKNFVNIVAHNSAPKKFKKWFKEDNAVN